MNISIKSASAVIVDKITVMSLKSKNMILKAMLINHKIKISLKQLLYFPILQMATIYMIPLMPEQRENMP